jgi:hypothetical protein
MALVGGKPICVIVPSDKEVSMKWLAFACGGKSAEMMRCHEAERLSGYHGGGVDAYMSPNRAKMVSTTNPPNDVPHVIGYEQSTGPVYNDADRPAPSRVTLAHKPSQYVLRQP